MIMILVITVGSEAILLEVIAVAWYYLNIVRFLAKWRCGFGAGNHVDASVIPRILG